MTETQTTMPYLYLSRFCTAHSMRAIPNTLMDDQQPAMGGEKRA